MGRVTFPIATPTRCVLPSGKFLCCPFSQYIRGSKMGRTNKARRCNFLLQVRSKRTLFMCEFIKFLCK
ncbi:hypothetical protein HanHA300_Chr13g0491731 [Helianthus annuus]|nr:hypothetical protein HanHA300_Chr13g0491731 [Helianthus annuus]